jgi:GLPGLI family protein
MKKVLLTLCLTVLTTIGLHAQLKEGHVKYKIDMSSDDPEMEMQMQMLQGSTFELYFAENKSRSEMNMGAFVSMTTITDVENDEMIMLMGGMMGNKAVKSTLSEIEEENEEDVPEMEVTLVDEEKEISGYNCKKAILTNEEGDEMIFWYTEEIEVNKKGQSFLNEDVPGFPLEFEITQGEMLMTMSVTEFEDKIEDKKTLFDMSIPEGYEEMTMEELQGMGM